MSILPIHCIAKAVEENKNVNRDILESIHQQHFCQKKSFSSFAIRDIFNLDLQIHQTKIHAGSLAYQAPRVCH